MTLVSRQPIKNIKNAAESHRHNIAKKKVDGSLPLVWPSKAVTTYRELFNMIGARYVEDYIGIVDGNAAIAALSLGLTYSCTNVSAVHVSYLVKHIDNGLMTWMTNDKSAVFQGAKMKELILKHFPKKPVTFDNSDSEEEIIEQDES